MNKKKQSLILITLVLILAGLGIAYYAFRPSPDSVKGNKAEYILSAEELISSYEQNETDANSLYLDKVIQVQGSVIEVSAETEGKFIVYLEGSLTGNISCLFNESIINVDELNIGDLVEIKGKCSGYILDVALTKCDLVK